MRLPAAIRAAQRTPLLLVVKSAIAVIGSWLLSQWLIPGPLPVFAAIAALLVVQPSLNQSFSKAVERSVGVILGVLLATTLGLFFGSGTWVILTAAACGLLIAWALRLAPGAATQIAISAILVLALGTATPDYALDRVIETILGAAIGVVVNVLLVPPVALAPARESTARLGSELSASLDRLAEALTSVRTRGQLEELMLEARLMRPMRDAADAAIRAGSESLTLNPRSGRHRAELAELTRTVELYTPIVTQVTGMTRAVYDHYSPDLVDEPQVRAIAEQLRRAAHDVERVGQPPAAVVEEPPALTTPLQITRPSATHWILIGSLLEDLHRIHHSLVEAGRRSDAD
ncbi:aromatic acid exporter family protein [Microbacterium sp. cx-59]|uniref:FUSC family protein n=1 Tax=Microbacterium sp. cx-59 TaxID=2891207 RepID=UPI001E5D30CC|nr:FUSC family protein [Microbacterium sp. cx-59]MCC4907566.1 FUSC family protein [Microbacterium sp. cx-59]